MKALTRRDFMKVFGLGTAGAAAALALAGCAKEDAPAAGGQTEQDASKISSVEDENMYAIQNAGDIPIRKDIKADASRKSTQNSDERYPEVHNAGGTIPDELTPFNTRDKDNLINCMYEGLVDRLNATEYTPRLAKDWSWKNDSTLTLNLYDYITDSDGNNLTAEDVVFSYNQLVASGFAREFGTYKECRAADKYQVEIEFNGPVTQLNAFNAVVATPRIFTQKAFESHDFTVDPVTTGPYTLENFVIGSTISWVVNDHYWQKPELASPFAKQNVTRIVNDELSDSSMNLIAFQEGKSTSCMIYEESLDDYLPGGKFEDKYILCLKVSEGGQTIFPNMSGKSVLSDDINLRLACFYAFDSQSFASAIGARSTGTVTIDASPAIADYDPRWNKVESYMTEYSVDKAKEYLKKSNYKGETLVIMSENNIYKQKIAIIMKEYLAAAGINSDVQIYDRAIVSTYQADPAAWDFFIGSNTDSYNVIAKYWKNYSRDNGAVPGETYSFIQDDKLEEMVQKANTIDGNTFEAVDEIVHYCIDNAYGYGCCYLMNVNLYTKDYAQFCEKPGSNNLYLNACDFYLD